MLSATVGATGDVLQSQVLLEAGKRVSSSSTSQRAYDLVSRDGQLANFAVPEQATTPRANGEPSMGSPASVSFPPGQPFSLVTLTISRFCIVVVRTSPPA